MDTLAVFPQWKTVWKRSEVSPAVTSSDQQGSLSAQLRQKKSRVFSGLTEVRVDNKTTEEWKNSTNKMNDSNGLSFIHLRLLHTLFGSIGLL